MVEVAVRAGGRVWVPFRVQLTFLGPQRRPLASRVWVPFRVQLTLTETAVAVLPVGCGFHFGFS